MNASCFFPRKTGFKLNLRRGAVKRGDSVSFRFIMFKKAANLFTVK